MLAAFDRLRSPKNHKCVINKHIRQPIWYWNHLGRYEGGLLADERSYWTGQGPFNHPNGARCLANGRGTLFAINTHTSYTSGSRHAWEAPDWQRGLLRAECFNSATEVIISIFKDHAPDRSRRRRPVKSVARRGSIWSKEGPSISHILYLYLRPLECIGNLLSNKETSHTTKKDGVLSKTQHLDRPGVDVPFVSGIGGPLEIWSTWK